MVIETGQHAIEVTDKSRTEGIIVMPTVVSDPPEAGGVKAVPETGKESPQWNVGIVGGMATSRHMLGLGKQCHEWAMTHTIYANLKKYCSWKSVRNEPCNSMITSVNGMKIRI